MESPLAPVKNEPVTVVVTAPASVEACARAWLPWVASAPAGSQLMIVVDGSEPDPASVKQLRIVHQLAPRGLGPCVQTALWSVETPLVLLASPENIAPADGIAALFDAIDEAEVVVACRNVGPTPPILCVADLIRLIGARIFLGHTPESRLGWPGWRAWRHRQIARRLFGITLSDPDSGLLLARRNSLAGIPVQSTGRFAWTEILAKANHLGRVFTETPAPTSTASAETFLRDAWAVFRNPTFDRPTTVGNRE